MRCFAGSVTACLSCSADGVSGTFPLWVQGLSSRPQGRQMGCICICNLNKAKRQYWPATACDVGVLTGLGFAHQLAHFQTALS